MAKETIPKNADVAQDDTYQVRDGGSDGDREGITYGSIRYLSLRAMHPMSTVARSRCSG
jgi:hypothetical protein